MNDHPVHLPWADVRRLKNPSPIGTQSHPVSNPDEYSNPVEEELDAREKFCREHEIDADAEAQARRPREV